MILHITKAKYIDEYKIEVSFNDGRNGIADLKEALHGPVFEPLKDTNQFSQFILDNTLDTITWQNGADLAPEYIYYQAFKDDQDLQNTFKEWGYID